MNIVINQSGVNLSWCRPDTVNHQLIIVHNATEFEMYAHADAFIDLNFNGIFFEAGDKPYLVNETIKTFRELPYAPANVGRFCGWSGLPDRPVWEVATNTQSTTSLKALMKAIGKQYEFVADQPGLVAPRILSMIINEAYYAIAEGISSPEEIDMAMKLGTSYPEGPINWANKIGIHHIKDLLTRLESTSARYRPHPLLLNHI
ncbi:MAG: 3-hydroxyacyl-CoA dehydrogenase family protein [Bacteroidota bacterium]